MELIFGNRTKAEQEFAMLDYFEEGSTDEYIYYRHEMFHDGVRIDRHNGACHFFKGDCCEQEIDPELVYALAVRLKELGYN